VHYIGTNAFYTHVYRRIILLYILFFSTYYIILFSVSATVQYSSVVGIYIRRRVPRLNPFWWLLRILWNQPSPVCYNNNNNTLSSPSIYRLCDGYLRDDEDDRSQAPRPTQCVQSAWGYSETNWTRVKYCRPDIIITLSARFRLYEVPATSIQYTYMSGVKTHCRFLVIGEWKTTILLLCIFITTEWKQKSAL